MERLVERGHPEVRFAHGSVFQFLDDGGTRIGVLAARAQVTKQAMAQLVAHLEHHGYVGRTADPEDRRATLVKATPKGAEVFAIAREYMRDVERLAGRRLGAGGVDELRRLLQELDEALTTR